jgi:excisionase family DNA binding protein
MQEITRNTRWQDLPEYLSVTETARYFAMKPCTVYQLVRERKIPHRLVGKAIRIPKEFFRIEQAMRAEESKPVEARAKRVRGIARQIVDVAKKLADEVGETPAAEAVAQ